MSSTVPSGAYAILTYLFERDLLMWMPRCKNLRALGVSFWVNACKLGCTCRDSSRGMGSLDWSSDSFPTG